MLGAISPLFNNIFHLLFDFYVKAGTRFSLRGKRLFEISEVERTRVDCSNYHCSSSSISQVNHSAVIIFQLQYAMSAYRHIISCKSKPFCQKLAHIHVLSVG